MMQQNKLDRVVVLLDMDCFYCQVEEKLNPALQGKPVAVVQYNTWRGGGIIAVNYAARAKGVTRHMRGDEAKKQCDDIILVSVPNVGEKADLSKYRSAGAEVANVLQRFTGLLERASVDEAYLDVTEAVHRLHKNLNAKFYKLQGMEFANTFAVGYSCLKDYINFIGGSFTRACEADGHLTEELQNEISLVYGAAISNEIRSAVKFETGYECSAGISHNKILAKLACGLNKPNKQTILSMRNVPMLFQTVPITKIKGLGGKFGDDIRKTLQVEFIGELMQFTETDLKRKIDDKNGSWLYNVCRGIDLDPVKQRYLAQSIGSSKQFPGKNSIKGLRDLNYWISELSKELSERLKKDIVENNRKAKQMVISFKQEIDGQDVLTSRTILLNNYEKPDLSKQIFEVIRSKTKNFFRADTQYILSYPIKFLGISVGKFESIPNGRNVLKDMFDAYRQRLIDEAGRIEGEDGIKPVTSSVATLHTSIQKHQEGTTILPDSKKSDSHKKIPEFFSLKQQKYEEKSTRSSLEEEQKGNNNPCEIQSNPETLRKEMCSSYEANDRKNDHQANWKDEMGELRDLEEVFASLDKETDCGSTKYGNSFVDSESNETESLSVVLKNTQTFCEQSLVLGNKRKYGDMCSQEDIMTNLCYNTEIKTHSVLPQKQTELLFTCTTCGEHMHNEFIQVHQDRHFAEQLSRVQESEGIKRFVPSTKCIEPPISQKSKKPKIRQTAAVKSNTMNIHKYLKPISETQIINNQDLRDEMLETCEECGLVVPAPEMSEHQDFHTAKKLHRQLNKLEVQTVNIPKKSTTIPLRSSTGKGNDQNMTTKSRSIPKPIHSYFSHSQSDTNL